MNRRELVDAYQNGRIGRDELVEGLVADGVGRREAEGYARSLAPGHPGAARPGDDPPGDIYGPGAPGDVYGPGGATVASPRRVIRIWFIRLPRWAWFLLLIGVPLLLVLLLFALCPREPGMDGGPVGGVEVGPDEGGLPEEEEAAPLIVVCVGTYHRPLMGDPSFDRLGLMSDLPPKTVIEGEHDGEMQSESLGPDGLVLFDFGISQFDDYGYAVFADGQRIERGTIAVGPEERACDNRVLQRLFRQERAAAREGAQEDGGPETPKAFARVLAAAIRQGDAAFLFDRLHPAVIDLYGEDQCRAHVQGLRDPTVRYRVRMSTGPAPWDWEVDGRSIPVEDVFTVALVRTVQGEQGRAEAHFALVDLLLYWFTDCGEPL